MKKTILLSLLIGLMNILSMQAQTTWNFTVTPDNDWNNLAADATNWEKKSDTRFSNRNKLSAEELIAQGQKLEEFAGLKFTVGGGDKVRIDRNNSFKLNGKDLTLIVPAAIGGEVTLTFNSASSDNSSRGFTVSGLNTSSALTTTSNKEKITITGTATATEVAFKTTGGVAIYGITSDTSNQGGNDDDDDPTNNDKVSHSTSFSTTVNQLHVSVPGNTYHYNTADLNAVDMDKATGNIKVNTKDGSDEFMADVTELNFSKAASEGQQGEINNQEGKVNIIESKGWLEQAYIKWNFFEGATSYHVYVKGGQYADYTRIDQPLVRQYKTYARADMPGLKAGLYSLKVVPVVTGAEVAEAANEATNIAVQAHQREGFAFKGRTEGIGAYNLDGTLKQGAKVFYVTAATAKTISTVVKTGSKESNTATYTGIQSIINGYQKGYDTTPMVFRIIGTIKDTDLDLMLSGEGLQLKGKSVASPLNITIEGIGEDACVKGFGFLLRNASSVELSNLGVLYFMDDGVSIDTDNSNIWVHNLDIFYGKPGSDSDQAKGDGSVDIKGDSKNITVSRNHFFDSGKCSLCGMKSETGPNWISYDHNWFDHSDSRMPRVRTMSVHIWNNYYDGVSKYGAGAVAEADLFVEGNYYRNTKYPMLISDQGHDGGTFDDHSAGMIKSYKNFMDANSKKHYTTYQENNTSFDAYEATTRDELVPETVKTIINNYSYSNWDSDSNLIYTYTPDAATDVPSVVTGFYGAGRMNHGDLKWTFTASDDASANINQGLKDAVTNYQNNDLVGCYE